MSLEEKYDALLKSYQSVTIENRNLQQRIAESERKADETEGQMEYLRKQLGKSLKQKIRNLESPSGSNHEDLSEAESQHSVNEEEDPRTRARARRSTFNFNSNEFRVDIPEFEGKLDPEEFLDWLNTVERVFDYKDVPEDKKVKLVALKLRKYVSLWWTNLCAKRVRNRKEKIRTWEKMKNKLKARFLPSSYVQDSYAHLHNLTQGNMSVDEYTREFEKLLIKCDISEPEEQTIVRYLGGLDPKYSNVIELQQYTTFDEVCVLAHKVEQQRRRQPMTREFSKPPNRSSPINKGSTTQPQRNPATNTPYPQRTQAPQRTFPPTRPNPTPMSARRCFKCQGLGHIASECPNRKVVTLMEWQTEQNEGKKEEEEEAVEEEEEEVAEEVTGADEGEMLVLRRALMMYLAKQHSPNTLKRGGSRTLKGNISARLG